MPLINLAEQVREIPVTQILQSEGFKADRQGQSIMFKDDNHSINVTGQKWFDHRHGKGGYGAIDLAIHLNQADFRQACVWLADRHGSNHQTNLPFPVAQRNSNFPPPPKESFEEQRARLAIDSPENMKIVSDYLTQTRGIESKYIDRNFVRATHSKDLPMLINATFLHRNIDGEVKGLTSRSTLHQTGMKSSLGSKSFSFFYVGDLKNANTVLLTESPIEALSLASLTHEMPNFEAKAPVCYLSVSGNSVPENLAQYLVDSKKKVVLALNSDVAGVQGTARAKETFSKMGHPNEIKILTPEGKDWNTDLREVRSQELEYQRENILVNELIERGKIIKEGDLYRRDFEEFYSGNIKDEPEDHWMSVNNPKDLIDPSDATQEERRQDLWTVTMEEARLHKANLLLDRAISNDIQPSREQKERLQKADWKGLKSFETSLSNYKEAQQNPFLELSESIQERVSLKPNTPKSRGIHH